MKSVYVSDLRPTEDITTVFLVQSKDIRQKKSGDPYLSLSLGDRSGAIDAKMWDNVADVLDTFGRDDFIRVKGRVQVYQNKPQLTVHKLQRIDDSEIEFPDFFPASQHDPEAMFAELREIVAGMSDPHLKRLLTAFLDDPEIADRYKRAPAAKSVHHAFLGGLLEHVLSLCRLCRSTAANYDFIDLDLLLAGAVLHDIGKIHELSYNRSFGYTDEGQLLGHIMIGIRMIDEKLRDLPDFPPKLLTLVQHMVLSHHGTLEFGSPKVPVFPEAMLFHFLDNIDSKMENMRAVTANDNHIEGSWTGYVPPLERYVLKKDAYLAGAAARQPEPAAAAQPASANVRPAQKPQPSLFGDRLQEALKDKS